METKRIEITLDNIEDIKEAATLILQGDVVAFPTETVYGLGGNGLNPEAVARIYEAKGRPSDNPLILHVCNAQMVEEVTDHITDQCKQVMEAFWPGPLTVILPKSEQVPTAVTGGLTSVAVRMPNHPVALALIEEAGVPIAAPSANVSGRPSPTKAAHVMEDLDGRIPMVLDGGAVEVGVESTIVDFTGKVPTLLRPGYITKEDMERTLGCEVQLNTSHEGVDNGVPKAPGMKYKHYAPKAEMTLVLGQDLDKVVDKIQELTDIAKNMGQKVGILATRETKDKYCSDDVIAVGTRSNMETVAAGLYDSLREFDHREVDVIFAEGFQGEVLEEAVMNRLMKAAGNRTLQV